MEGLIMLLSIFRLLYLPQLLALIALAYNIHVMLVLKLSINPEGELTR